MNNLFCTCYSDLQLQLFVSLTIFKIASVFENYTIHASTKKRFHLFNRPFSTDQNNIPYWPECRMTDYKTTPIFQISFWEKKYVEDNKVIHKTTFIVQFIIENLTQR